MPLNLWTPDEMFRLVTDDRFDDIPSFFLDNFFNATHFSQEKNIVIAELPRADRMMAPFVLPTDQGKPVFTAKDEAIRAFTPAYIKVKDATRPLDSRTPRPSEVFNGRKLSLQERFNLRTLEVAEQHRRKIKMREAWMAARAIIDGQVTIRYDRDQGTDYPEVIIGYGRDAGHTVVKGSNYWSDPATLILDDIQTWADTMFNAVRGGYPVQLLVGSAVAPFFKKNTQILKELEAAQVRRGAVVDIQTGITRAAGIAQPLVYVGPVGQGIDVWQYRDQVEAPNGTMVDILDPKDIVLVAPGVDGVRAYGAIYDAEAMMEGVLATDLFAKQWISKDPGEVYTMHASSPLPIVIQPNKTFKARVLA